MRTLGAVIYNFQTIGCFHVVLLGESASSESAEPARRTQARAGEMTGTAQQCAGVSPRILIRTLRCRQQFPGSAGVFPPFPFDVAGE